MKTQTQTQWSHLCGAPPRRYTLQSRRPAHTPHLGWTGLSSNDLAALRRGAEEYIAANPDRGETIYRIVDGNYTPGIMGGHEILSAV